jgi:hypothetical protein
MKIMLSINTTDSKRIHSQKRLVLANLKQSYMDLKHTIKTGLSKILFFMTTMVHNSGIQGNRFRERENVHTCEMHHNLKLLDAALPEQKDCRFLFENLVSSRVSHNFMIHRR